jgi:diadenosine tetraphosphate (Ap4A) HIT family hydrolase
MESVCYICGQLDGVASRDLLAPALGGRYVRRVPIETNSFGVFPSLGALTAGHALVVPKQHWRSCAECPEDVFAHLNELILDLRRGLESITDQRVHVFEHGSGRRGSIACSIEHGHQHLVPANIEIDLPDLDGTIWESIDPGMRCLADRVGAQEYLYYSPRPSENYVAVLPDGAHAKSQLMRRVFAAGLGIIEWDWRADDRAVQVRGTLELLNQVAARSTQLTGQTV